MIVKATRSRCLVNYELADVDREPGINARGPGFCRGRARSVEVGYPTADLSSPARSVRSQEKSGSSRPKWP